MSAIIHQFNHSNRSSEQDINGKLKPLISQIASCLNEELSELIGRMFDGADDMLFQLAENADSNEDQNEYFDTMRMLRVERKQIGQSFAANLKTYLQPANKQNKETEILEDELSLVDQDEMEEMVAVTAMHSKAMSLYGETVNHLEARIEFLSLKSNHIFNKDALAPKNICDSFKDALIEIELSTNNKLVLYKLFDQEVILNLETLYLKLNQIFIDQGILPQIKSGVPLEQKTAARPQNKMQAPAQEQVQTQAPETDAVYTENPTYNTGQASTFSYSAQTQFQAQPQGQGQYQAPTMGNHTNTNSSANTNAPQQLHQVVSQFINGELTASGPGIPASFTTKGNAPSASGTQYYDRRDVMHALSNLQHNVAQSDASVEQIDAADFKRALLADMGSRNGGAITKQVNLVDEKTIDFIEMLFDAITEDISISEAVTNLLLRLQIPVIKVAMLDKNFFPDGEHPCRTTLNLIAHLGRGLTAREDALFLDLSKVVESLLDDFDININSFDNAQQQLEKIELNEIQKIAAKEKSTQKIVLQKHAREVVLTELQYHVINKELPKVAQKLILKLWSTLMFHRYIKFGKSSDNWCDAVSAVSKLIKLLQPIESSHAYNQLDTEKDNVLGSIHNDLLDTKQNPVEIETEINNVFLNFEDMLKNSDFNSANASPDNTYFANVEDAENIDDDGDFLDSMPEPELDFEEEIVDPLLEQTVISREKIAKLPTEVRPGVWFKVFTGENTAARRVKLSVIIMEEAKLIFVDRVGVKVTEKDAEQFTHELNSETSQIIADHSAFDHALGMVISSLSTTV
ncbi:hypothetical protein MNBD_GAMMA08-1048 [hydrothermal vent metagenome]|uniref:Thymidine phosphorylase n=1 Tax=hydrothermal vent metagenome TaxID=652676 RepID=A0A3B0XLP9_9ZZZZ